MRGLEAIAEECSVMSSGAGDGVLVAQPKNNIIYLFIRSFNVLSGFQVGKWQ